MTVYVFDYAGRMIDEGDVRTTADAYGFGTLFGNWHAIIVRSKTGRLVEFFVRQ